MDGAVRSSGLSRGKPAPKKALADSKMSHPPVKKLKQGRLPFKPLEPKPVILPVVGSPNSRKRKLSDSLSGPQKASKTKKSEEHCAHLPSVHPKANDADNEVSSSSELVEEQQYSHSSGKDSKPKVVGLIDKFLKTTQQREVSTSCGDEIGAAASPIDLTESGSEAESRGRTSDHETDTGMQYTDDCLELDSKEEISEKLEDCSEGDAEDGVESLMEQQNCSRSEITEEKDVLAACCAKEAEQMEEERLATETAEAVSPSSSKASSPETGPSANDSKTPSSAAKRSRTRLPLSSEKKAKKDAERKRREEEKERLRQEKQKAKAEKERLKKEEKEKKEQEKVEAKLKKEKEKQEKQEQKEREKKAREEEQKKREEEKRKVKEAAEAEKKKKEDERKRKEEERKKKEEEKQKLEDEKIKKQQKAQEAFQSFFTKASKTSASAPAPQLSGKFMSFEVKKDMRLAPRVRVKGAKLTQKVNRLNSLLHSQDWSQLYLQELKEGKIDLGSACKTWPCSPEKDLEVSGDGSGPASQTMKTKFLKFHENYRPPYYGTWRKRSKKICPRRPLNKDEELLDYEVDSDEEWEEEEPGESLSHSEGEDEDDEKDGDNEEEDEDGFFVPHGYLSEGEGGEDDEEDMSPEAMKARQLAKARAWDAEMTKKCVVLRPVCLGCCWTGEPDARRDAAFEKLAECTMVPLLGNSFPIAVMKSQESDSQDKENRGDGDKNSKDGRLKPVPEEAIPDLIRLVHGNLHSFKKIAREFRAYWKKMSDEHQTTSEKAGSPGDEHSHLNIQVEAPKESEGNKGGISKRQLEMKVKEIAVYEGRSGCNVRCWYVKQEILQKYKLVDLPVPTQWQWITGARKTEKESCTGSSPGTVCQTPTSDRQTPIITNFTKEVSPSSLFSTNVSKTTCGSKAVVTPKERNSTTGTPTQKTQSVAKKTPNIKQFAVRQASPTFSTPKSVCTPEETVSPLARPLKYSPRTPLSRDTTLEQDNETTQADKAKEHSVALPTVLFEKPENHRLEEERACKLPKGQTTLLSMLGKAVTKEKIVPESSAIKEGLEPDKNANSVVAEAEAPNAEPTGKWQGQGTAEEPMELD